MFKFQVTPKGKIESINVEGNLPSVLVDSVKERIQLTEDKWIFSNDFKEQNKKIEFFYPIYIQQSQECNFKIHESYDLMKILFKKHSVISIDNDIYVVEPIICFANIRCSMSTPADRSVDKKKSANVTDFVQPTKIKLVK